MWSHFPCRGIQLDPELWARQTIGPSLIWSACPFRGGNHDATWSYHVLPVLGQNWISTNFIGRTSVGPMRKDAKNAGGRMSISLVPPAFVAVASLLVPLLKVLHLTMLGAFDPVEVNPTCSSNWSLKALKTFSPKILACMAKRIRLKPWQPLKFQGFRTLQSVPIRAYFWAGTTSQTHNITFVSVCVFFIICMYVCMYVM